MSCKCKNAYDAINNNHRNCFLKLKDNRFIEHSYESLNGGSGLTLIGHAALEAKNHDFTLFLLEFEDLRKEISQLGFNCLFEALLYNNSKYYKLFTEKNIDSSLIDVPPISELIDYHELFNIAEKDTTPSPINNKTTRKDFIFEFESW